MRKEEKAQIIESIAAQLKETPNFYVTDISGLNAKDTTKWQAHQRTLQLVKKALLHRVIKQMDNEELNLIVPTLVGNSAIMYTETASTPAKLIKKLRKDGLEKPELKSAYVQECAYVGADKLDILASIKSKEELIGDVIAALQAPARNVISALQNGGGSTIAGLVKTLSEKEEK